MYTQMKSLISKFSNDCNGIERIATDVEEVVRQSDRSSSIAGDQTHCFK